MGMASILYCGMYKSVLASKIGADTVNSLLAIVLLGGASMSGRQWKDSGHRVRRPDHGRRQQRHDPRQVTDYWITALTGFIILAAMLLQFVQKKRHQ